MNLKDLKDLRVLAFWWAAWTLADVYLIPFSPWAELVVLGVLLLSRLVSKCAWVRAAELRSGLQKHLEEVTQTGGPSGGAREYGRQADEAV